MIRPMEETLFYDIEVFKEDYILVFKRYDKSVHSILVNTTEGLHRIVNEYQLIGYNNYSYDDVIVGKMLAGAVTPMQVKIENDKIFDETRKREFAPHNIDSLDCFRQLTGGVALKKVQMNLGENIHECPIDFTIDRKLTEDELQLAIEYCCSDVDSTIDVFNLINKSRDSFYIKGALDELTGGWKKSSIGTNLSKFFGSIEKWWKPKIDENINELLPDELRYHFAKLTKPSTTPEEAQLTLDIWGNELEIGSGGAHSVHPKYCGVMLDNVILLDYASMYPNIMNKFKIIGKNAQTYLKWTFDRVAIKHTKPMEAEAMKLALNRFYGLLKYLGDKTKPWWKEPIAYDKHKALSVCLIGQQYLCYLSNELYKAGYDIVQLNTDGVAFIECERPITKHYKDVWKDCENTIGSFMKLEDDVFTKFIQKDVNNYIGYSEHEVSEKKDGIKAKGAFVKNYKGDNWSSTNKCGIVDLALVNYFIHGIPFSTTIYENRDNLILFQITTSINRKTFDYTMDNNGTVYHLHNRLFAVTRDDALTRLFKVKNLVQEAFEEVDDELNVKTTNFPKLPSRFIICNDALRDVSIPDLDLNYYLYLAEDRLQKFIKRG